MNPSPLQVRMRTWLLAMGLIFGVNPAWALLPFPLAPNQTGLISCLENPNYAYWCYLPPAYSTNGPALPILYTMNPAGGGMLSTFKPACSSFNTICIGIIQPRNGLPWDQVLEAYYAVTRDVRQRVLYDPTEELAGGFSGGGECAYMFSRFRSQHVAGLIELAGWLARINNGPDSVQYYGIDRVQTNLLIARTTGDMDANTIFYNPLDSNFLATCGVKMVDYSFSGGHQVPPEAVIESCLQWIQTNHVPAAPGDQTNAQAMADNWQVRIAAGQSESVFRECVSNLLNFPRSWYAYQAQLTLDQLFTNYDVVRQFDVSNLAQGDFATDLFYYYARGAATNADWPRFDSCLKALTGITVTNDFCGTTVISNINITAITPTTDGMIYITTTNNDHAGDIYALLTNYNHYPGPLIQISVPPPGGMNLSLVKDVPGLAYSAQSRTDLVNDVWQDIPVVALDTNTLWSGSFNPPSNAGNGYYRVVGVPTPADSPPWPPQ